MKLSDIDSVVVLLREDLEKLLKSNIYNIVDVKKGKKDHGVPGVYLIHRPDTLEIVYVGRTTTGTISNRMHQHLHMKENRDLQMMIKKHPDYPQDKTMYKVQYVELKDARKRFFLENFAVSILQLPLNG